ncbi:MAG TPA: winged helix-turn-helix domain-containing protein [Vitreimonas sp.]|jgi:DNA-binding transcriptional ArsR family regulator|nr:winged helix-turn-helix domain-containing protein [Vitreimonas sp.]
MKDGPKIAGIAALIGDPARANMLTALMHGAALTASELALEAGVTKQTASAHLSKLADAELITAEAQGRHRYFRLADADVARALESLMGVAARAKALRTRPGPKEPALRHARVCYDHLAGDMGVELFDALVKARWLAQREGEVTLSKRGREAFEALGLDIEALEGANRPLCRACLDWSVRRNHLAGGLGAGLLQHVYGQGWARRRSGTRVVEFTSAGERAFRRTFGIEIQRDLR